MKMPQTLADKLVRSNVAALKPYQSARSQAEAEEGFLLLDAAENPFCPFDDEDHFLTNSLNRYPEPQPREVLEKLADIYSVEADNVLITRGSEEAIRLVIQAFCQPRQDKILLCPPTFGLYVIEANIHDIETVNVPRLGEYSEELDIQGIREAIDTNSNIKCVFVCNPGNPSSTPIPTDQIEELLIALKDECMVIVDEAYIEFASHESFAQKIQEYSNLIVLRTLSKSYGLAGLRCGTIVADADILKYFKRITAAYPVPRSSAEIILSALSPERQKYMREQQQLICTERDRIVRELQKLEVIKKVYPSDTNFICVEVEDAHEMSQKLRENKVIVRVRSPAIPNSLNIAVGTKEQNDHVLKSLEEINRRS